MSRHDLRGWMMKLAIVGCALLLSRCSNYVEVEVIAIQDAPDCFGAENQMTLFDGGEEWGRFKRCGVWGKVGESFYFSKLQ